MNTVFFLFLPSILIVIILFIFRNNKIDSYDCHIRGCYESFETMEELIKHLIVVHGYEIDEKDYRK